MSRHASRRWTRIAWRVFAALARFGQDSGFLGFVRSPAPKYRSNPQWRKTLVSTRVCLCFVRELPKSINQFKHSPHFKVIVEANGSPFALSPNSKAKGQRSRRQAPSRRGCDLPIQQSNHQKLSSERARPDCRDGAGRSSSCARHTAPARPGAPRRSSRAAGLPGEPARWHAASVDINTNSGLARACVARHHQHLRRNRSCDKETSAGDAGSASVPQ